MTQRPLKAIEAGSIPVPPTNSSPEERPRRPRRHRRRVSDDDVRSAWIDGRSSNGRTTVSDAVYLGSNPSLPTGQPRQTGWGSSLTIQRDFGTSASPRPQGVEKLGVRDRPQIIRGGYSGRAESGILSRVCARGPNKASAEGGLRILPPSSTGRIAGFSRRRREFESRWGCHGAVGIIGESGRPRLPVTEEIAGFKSRWSRCRVERIDLSLAVRFMKYTKEVLEKAVASSASYLGVLRYFGFDTCAGGTYGWIRSRIQHFEIDTSHFTGRASQLGRSFVGRRSAEQILVRRNSGPRTETTVLKRAMLEWGFEYRCSECRLLPTWNGKPLKIQVDHRDGDWRNDLPGNLRFLCPNCHSQTPTHSIVKNKRALSTSKRERPFPGPRNLPKISWPSSEQLASLVQSAPVTSVAKQLGVSDKAVLKRCRKLGIQTHPPGYWTKRSASRGELQRQPGS